MKKLKYIVLLLLFMVLASSANGQSPCGDDGLCVVQFNAGFNEANKVPWVGELNECSTTFIDIQTDAAAAKGTFETFQIANLRRA